MACFSSFSTRLLVALAITIIATALFAAGCVDNKTYLSKDDKTKAISIALSDNAAMGKVGQVTSKFHWQEGMIFNSTNPVFYQIGNVTVDRVHEVAPGVDRIRYLPSVELIMGNRSQGDVNVYVYVDLGNETVAYVGFTNRSGPDAGQFRYTQEADGVAQHMGDSVSLFKNVTVVDSGYALFRGMTDQDKSALLDVIKKNETVAAFINNAAGRGEHPDLRIHLFTDEGQIDGHSYVVEYAELKVDLKKPDGSYDPKYLIITMDDSGTAVKSVSQGELLPPPITPCCR